MTLLTIHKAQLAFGDHPLLDDAEFTLNKQPTGETTIEGVIEAYRTKRPKWPVPLTDGVAA